MKISYLWICELLPALRATPQEVADKLTLAGVEVEGIHELGLGLEEVVVAQVLEKSKHPNADRLNVCQVYDGTNKYQIVCGATNVAEGGIYPMAKVGAVLPNGLTIKKSSIRGIESSGMLCSSKELGLAEESDGLLSLSEQAKLGQSFREHWNLQDTILEINLTPNRGDCLSHQGVAFEIATLFNLPFEGIPIPQVRLPAPDKPHFNVTISSPHCSRYTGVLLSDVHVGPSPEIISRRLESLGIRSINNIVDATNYVMLLTGHPTHAFDADTLSGHNITVTEVDHKESFKTLDDKSRDLLPGDLVISDSKQILALAGVMGGSGSQVTNKTKNIFLEVASFDSSSVRATARRLGIVSDSSHRFERGVSDKTVMDSMKLLLSLILETAKASIKSDIIDVYSNKTPEKTITLRRSRLFQYTGVNWSENEVSELLSSLHLSPLKDGDSWSVRIPARRNDLVIEEDIIEELVRLKGFDAIESDLPNRQMKKVFLSKEKQVSRLLRQYLVSKGYKETIHYSFVGESDLEPYELNKKEGLVKLTNPLSDELSIMRPSLLPKLFETARNNLRHNPGGDRYFELRRVYSTNGETLVLSILSIGNRYIQNWGKLNQESSFFELKGLLEDILAMGHATARYVIPKETPPYLHPGQATEFKLGNANGGTLGSIHPKMLAYFDVKLPVTYLQIDMSVLISSWRDKGSFKANLSDQPTNRRDLSLLIPLELSYGDLQKAIVKKNVKYLNNINIFDIYKGDKIEAGKQSISLSLEYCDSERTLTDEEVNEVHFKLVADLQSELSVSLR